mmetsp:Transcript_60976/g.139462  ORF Transcript_60976/g.139462 Transcript_60976/m.139462 type:complete len:343 (-) Transcript_60976:73-1101(-)
MSPGNMVASFALLIALAAAPLVHGHPEKLTCTQDISASAMIMGQSVQASAAKTVKIAEQPCGGTINTGTAYSLTLGGTENKYVVDLSGTATGTFATKMTGSGTVCDKRTTASSDTVTFTAAGTAIFRMTTATGYGTATTTETTCDYTVQAAESGGGSGSDTTAASGSGATEAEAASTTPSPSSDTTAGGTTGGTKEAATPTEVFVEMSVTVPLTIAEFTDAKKTSFRKGVANSAGTAIDKVEITEVKAADRRRRMLLETSISVDFRVKVTEAKATELKSSGALSEAKLNEKLKAEGLPAVTVTKAATVTKSAAHRLAGGGMLARTLLSLGVALLVHRAAALG